jgi:hypothetical protein
MSEITYKTVLEALLPPGSLWRPKKTIAAESEVGVELVTNGTFDTDLSGWTISFFSGGVDWEAPGVMELWTAPS